MRMRGGGCFNEYIIKHYLNIFRGSNGKFYNILCY